MLSKSVPALQAHEEHYVQVLPAVGQRVKVSFYSTTCEALAGHHPVLRALLSAASKPRQALAALQTHVFSCDTPEN